MKRVSGGPRSAIAGALAAAVVALLGGVATQVASAATITPTVNTDAAVASNGNCTLREAVQAANTNLPVDTCPAGDAAQPDTIVLPDAFYPLTHTGSGENSNATGDLDVITTAGAGPLVIQSDGDLTEINGNFDDRVIDDLTSGSSLILDRIRLNDGEPPSGDGGAFRSTGSSAVSLLDSEVKNSSTIAKGGGLRVNGDLTLTGSEVSGNTSTAATGVVGAGISSGGDLVIDSSTVSANHVDAPDDANTDDLRGGGIAAQAGSISIVDSTIANNEVNALDPSDTAGGGALFAQSVSVTITDSTVSGNSVDHVGGISVAGGVFFNDAAPLHFLKVQNSTFSANSSQLQGGAMQVFDGISGVKSSTFSQNISGSGKAIVFDDSSDPFSSVQIGGTILSDGGTSECAGADALTTNGFNIDRGNSCALTGTGDLQNTNTNLLGLTDNGGPTQTHALPAGSLALDRIPIASCTQIDTTPLTTDQREAPRGFDEDGDGIAECDVGAYELNRCQGAIVDLVGPLLNGTSASDVILGNPGFDLIDPKEGNDKICAGGGDDRVIERPGGGTDSIDGESGSDTVALGNGTTPPAGTIDLLAGTGSIPSGTGTTFALDSVENGQGSVQTDTLIGDGGPNELDGGIGNDTLTGGGGADELLGGNDADQIFARDGVADTVDCGTGTDNAQTDRLSLDSVTGCEALDAIAEPVVLPPSQTPAKKKCKKRKHGKRATAAKKCKKKKRR